MKIVTSIGLFNDAIGKRISITYSEIDDKTGQIISDNKRIDRVITPQNKNAVGAVDELEAFAQGFIDEAD